MELFMHYIRSKPNYEATLTHLIDQVVSDVEKLRDAKQILADEKLLHTLIQLTCSSDLNQINVNLVDRKIKSLNNLLKINLDSMANDDFKLTANEVSLVQTIITQLGVRLSGQKIIPPKLNLRERTVIKIKNCGKSLVVVFKKVIAFLHLQWLVTFLTKIKDKILSVFPQKAKSTEPTQVNSIPSNESPKETKISVVGESKLEIPNASSPSLKSATPPKSATPNTPAASTPSILSRLTPNFLISSPSLKSATPPKSATPLKSSTPLKSATPNTPAASTPSRSSKLPNSTPSTTAAIPPLPSVMMNSMPIPPPPPPPGGPNARAAVPAAPDKKLANEPKDLPNFASLKIPSKRKEFVEKLGHKKLEQLIKDLQKAVAAAKVITTQIDEVNTKHTAAQEYMKVYQTAIDHDKFLLEEFKRNQGQDTLVFTHCEEGKELIFYSDAEFAKLNEGKSPHQQIREIYKISFAEKEIKEHLSKQEKEAKQYQTAITDCSQKLHKLRNQTNNGMKEADLRKVIEEKEKIIEYLDLSLKNYDNHTVTHTIVVPDASAEPKEPVPNASQLSVRAQNNAIFNPMSLYSKLAAKN